MEEERELVMVGYRDEEGVPCRNGCGFLVGLDPKGARVIAAGGSLICRPCARKLWRLNPEAWEKANEWWFNRE